MRGAYRESVDDQFWIAQLKRRGQQLCRNRRITIIKHNAGSGEGFQGAGPLRRWDCARGRRSKASQGGNRGEVGGPFGERAYGDLRIADG